ncbi:MAG: citramalate synthase [bacterium]|nr:citramalate synthase [bacterium]
MKLLTYDTTLRDGAQTEGISFSLEDKLRIVQKLDDFGIDYIECGWPGSNPKDMLLFSMLREFDIKHAKITAFGSTRRKDINVYDDINFKNFLEAKSDAVCIFGKTWDLHVKDALRTTLAENLAMISDSISFLKEHNFEVIYDAEHFFDGYKANPLYAEKILKTAEAAGADQICLCDTNGGMLPFEIETIISSLVNTVNIPLGIHTHNDAGTAVANSIMAIKCGATIVQGTINGYGERCGNADLTSIIPAAAFKMGLVVNADLKKLKETSFYISEVANKVPHDNQPYVGYSAFSHKAGIHVSAVERNSKTYEHIMPEEVGNKRRIVVSELSGKSNILAKARDFNIDLDEKELADILRLVKDKENDGLQYEGAEASLELLMRKNLSGYQNFFDLEGFKVIIEKDDTGKITSKAIIKIVVEGVEEHTASNGAGPVNALDNALRKALEKFYPQLKEVGLSDFKVRVVGSGGGTESKVRVLIETRDTSDEWLTIGASENVIEASWQALVDAVEYKLLK